MHVWSGAPVFCVLSEVQEWERLHSCACAATSYKKQTDSDSMSQQSSLGSLKSREVVALRAGSVSSWSSVCFQPWLTLICMYYSPHWPPLQSPPPSPSLPHNFKWKWKRGNPERCHWKTKVWSASACSLQLTFLVSFSSGLGQPLRSITLPPHLFYLIVVLSGKPWKGVLCSSWMIYGVAGRANGREALKEGGAASSTAGYFRNGGGGGGWPSGLPSPLPSALSV